MNIEEIVSKYYQDIRDGKESSIDGSALFTFCEEYIEINRLKELYKQNDVNRKEIGLEILERKKNLEKLIEVFRNNLGNGCVRYLFPENISDYSKVFNLLLILANENEEKYSLKKFNTTQYGSLETRHGDKEGGMFNGEILVVGEKDVLDKIDNSKPYYGSKFGDLATKIIENNHSIAMITNHYYETNVMPYKGDIKARVTVLNVDGTISNLCCYTFDDELGNAVDKLRNYINIYGGDIDNIDINEIVKRINQKDLVKVIRKK